MTYKKGQPRYFVGVIPWRYVSQQARIPVAMREHFTDRWSRHPLVMFYEYPDGFYAGLEDRQLWKLNSNHEQWAKNIFEAYEGL